MIKISQSGSAPDKTLAYLGKLKKSNLRQILEKYGPEGVNALANATPEDHGETARSWYYEIVERKGYISLRWHNSHLDPAGTPIAILLEYGHATRNGGYVQGHEFIMFAIRPIFDQIEAEIRKEVTG